MDLPSCLMAVSVLLSFTQASEKSWVAGFFFRLQKEATAHFGACNLGMKFINGLTEREHLK